MSKKLNTLIVILLLVSGMLWVPAFGKGIPGTMVTPAAQSAQPVSPEDYRLGPNDVVRIFVEGHPEWSGEFTVKPDGNIFLKDIGDVCIKDMNRDEVQAALVKAMERYITNPRVSLEMLQYKSQTIYILGEVNRPGEYPTGGKSMTLKDAIVLAGLPARFADTGRVSVITPSASGKPKQRIVNLDRVLNRGELKNNVEVKPGDIVYVPQSLLGRINNFFSAILSPAGSVGMLRY